MATRSHRVGSMLSHHRVSSILDTNAMRRVQRHLLRAFDLDEHGARRATEHLVRRVLDDIGARYARDMGRHIDAVIDLRTRLTDMVDAATRGEHPAENIDTLLADLQTHMDALKPLSQYLQDNPPVVDADAVRGAVDAGGSGPPRPRTGDAPPPPPNPRIEALRDRIHEMGGDLDAHAIESRLSAAERLFAEGRAAEANRLVDQVENSLGVAESAPRRRTDSGDAADARERARDADLTTQTGPPGNDTARTRQRLAALRQRISGWADRIANLPAEFGRLRDAADAQLRSIRERLRRGEHVSDAEIESLEGLVRSINDGVRATSRRVSPERLDGFARTLARRLERLGRERPSERRTRMEAEIREIQAGIDRIRSRTDPNSPNYDPNYRPGPDYARLRRRAREMGRRDGEVHIDMTDPLVRARITAWFTQHAQPLLAAGPIGEILYRRLMHNLSTRDEISLGQSPRTAGAPTRQTDSLRREFLDHLNELPPDYQAAFLDAARRDPQGWPGLSEGRPWEVDHVDELWAGGADEGPNLMALPPGLHRQHDAPSDGPGIDPSKTGILEDFRQSFRDALQREDESVDLREADEWPEDIEP